MNDMSATIIPKSDQLNSDDLISGPRTVTVSKVNITVEAEQPVAVFYDEDPAKPFKLCKSMRRVLVTCWGPDANAYVGRKMTLYRDPAVKFGGLAVGGIRISHLSHIERDMTMALTESRANRKPFTVKPLKVDTAQQQSAASKSAEWAALWRSRIADPEATAPRLSTSWGSPQNNAARDKHRRENADLEAAVTREVMACIEMLEQS